MKRVLRKIAFTIRRDEHDRSQRSDPTFKVLREETAVVEGMLLVSAIE